VTDGPAQTSPTKGLGKKTRRGITWTLIGAVLSNGLRIAFLAVLGRLLTAAEFGLVAAALTAVGLAQAFKGIGLGIALVQRRELEPSHVESAFGFSLLFSLTLAGVMFLGAPAIGDLYNMPAATPLLRALSVMFLLQGVASTSSFLSQREMRFRPLVLIDLTAYIAGCAIGIGLAVWGAGAWSLVGGYLVEATVSCVALLRLRPPPLRFRIRWRPLRDLLGFGSGQTAAGIANYFGNQGDYIVVGRWLGAVALGFYTRAYELVRYPSLIFQNILGTVLFSSFSRLQGEPERLGQAFRRVLFLNGVLLLPASAGLVVLAPEAIYLLMGPGWESAVLPLQIMATSMLFRTSYKASGIVARSSSDVFRVAGWQLVYAIAVTGGALLTVRWGIVGVSCTTALAVVLNFLTLTSVALRRVTLGWGAILRAHIPGLAAALLVVAGALPVALALRAAGASVVAVAAAGVVAGSVGPVGLALYWLRRGDEDWVWARETLRQVVSRRKRKAEKRRLAASAPAGESER
jgi:PST family polysaccharide transporter